MYTQQLNGYEPFLKLKKINLCSLPVVVNVLRDRITDECTSDTDLEVMLTDLGHPVEEDWAEDSDSSSLKDF